MALKNLIAQKAVLTEEAIESIIADFVRYDIEELEIAFLPSTVDLSGRDKLLVYLVALQGWQFVSDETVASDAKPAELEDVLGIPGGTLRPILKDFKDRHVIAEKGGRYSVRAATLGAIEAELKSPRGSSPARKKRSPSPRKKKRKSVSSKDSVPNDVNQKDNDKKRSSGRVNKGIKEKLYLWISGGFFDDGRILSEIQNRFHEAAIIIPRTSLPSYLLAAVRDGKLKRSKKDVGGKNVWVYETNG